MQHGAGAGIEWVAVIKCVGCRMQKPMHPATASANLYPNSSKSLKVSFLAVKLILLSDATVKYTSGSKAS